MRVNRRFLYTGVFLIAIGAVVVAADIRAVDTATLADALRLWPLAIVAVGASLVLRRTPGSLPVGMLAAGLPGLVLGGALAVAPRFVGDCGAVDAVATSAAPQQGTFDGPASVSIRGGCGSITVGTAPGAGWHISTGIGGGQPPRVGASATSLSIDSIGDDDWRLFDGSRDAWNVTLPTSDIDALSLNVTASDTRVALPGAHIGNLTLTANASAVALDATGASIAHLSAAINVGRLSIHLPADSDLAGTFRVGGGELQVCTAPGVGLRVTSKGFAEHLAVAGLRQTGSQWQSADYASMARHDDLTITTNFGSVEINPIGGCK